MRLLTILWFHFLLTLSHVVFAQKSEFDKACRIIQEMHGSDLPKKWKTMVIEEQIQNGEFEICLYLSGLIPVNGALIDVLNSPEQLAVMEKTIFNKPIKFDPKTSRYFSKRKLNSTKNGILIRFVKFDGKFLRVNATIGHDMHQSSMYNRHYEYQFVFVNQRVRQLNWLEKLY